MVRHKDAFMSTELIPLSETLKLLPLGAPRGCTPTETDPDSPDNHPLEPASLAPGWP